MTTTTGKRRQLITQKYDHDHGKEEATKNIRRRPWPQWWPGGTQEDDHGHGDDKEEFNKEHKKMTTTMTMAKRKQPKTQEDNQKNRTTHDTYKLQQQEYL
jgi:hypothetical protein